MLRIVFRLFALFLLVASYWSYWVYNTQQNQTQGHLLCQMERDVWMPNMPHFGYTAYYISNRKLTGVCVNDNTSYESCEATFVPVFQDANGIPIPALLYHNSFSKVIPLMGPLSKDIEDRRNELSYPECTPNLDNLPCVFYPAQ